MVSPGILNPVSSALNTEAAGEGVAIDAPGASGADVSGVLGGAAVTEHPEEDVQDDGRNAAQGLFTQLLTARNLRLGRTMSQSEFNNVVAESLADWALVQHLPHTAASATVPGNAGPGVSLSSNAVIQPGRSVHVLLAGGEYAAPDLVRHVRNMQYAPLSMFSVKEMRARRLSNIAYPTKIEVDTVTSKKKTVINTDEFAITERSISRDAFVECYKGFTRVHQEVFAAEVHADFCRYQQRLFLHEFFDRPGLFSVISRFDSYMRLTWIQPHGRFSMASDDTFRVLERFDREVREEREEETRKRLDDMDRASGSRRDDARATQRKRSASPNMRFRTSNERTPSSARCVLCARVGHFAPSCTVRTSKCRFKNGDLTSKSDDRRVCFLFNTAKGCTKGQEHNHVCSVCLASTHSAQKCTVAL